MSKIFSKAELIGEIAALTDLPRVKVERVFDELAKAIHERTAGGRTVVLPGVGRFTLKARAARMGRNPATGAPIEIPASTALTFKASKAMA